jgi:hypothetical protein
MLTFADFTQKRKFRVIKPGCELIGELPRNSAARWRSNNTGPKPSRFGGYPESWHEIRIPLAVGAVLICDGPRENRHCYNVVQWRNEKGQRMAFYCRFLPPCPRELSDYDDPYEYPDPTCLEPIEEPPEAKRRWWQQR